jgi:DNA invertase Pin-like site-specific DNA recombinase
MALTIKDLKGAKTILYCRLSYDEVPKADKKKDPAKIPKLKLQIQRFKDFCKANGLNMPKPEHIFLEVASGGDSTRPVWLQAINTASQMKGKRFIGFTDLSRWSRDMRNGVAQTIPLYNNDVPMLSADDNLIIGTKKRPAPDGDTLLGIKITLAGGERENLRRRTQSAMTAMKKGGLYTSKGLELFPMADIDPYDFIEANLHRAASIKKGGIGISALGRLVMDNSGPNGPQSEQWARKAVIRISEQKQKMSPAEYEEWKAYRKRIRKLEKTLGANDWKVKALRYRTNGYLTAPLEEVYSTPPIEEAIQEYMANPRENLSAKEAKKYRSEVSKR